MDESHDPGAGQIIHAMALLSEASEGNGTFMALVDALVFAVWKKGQDGGRDSGRCQGRDANPHRHLSYAMQAWPLKVSDLIEGGDVDVGKVQPCRWNDKTPHRCFKSPITVFAGDRGLRYRRYLYD